MKNHRVCIAVMVCAALAARPASAVIVAGDYATVSDATVNTSAPPDDPNWHNVGTVGGASAIYLGNNWVLSANHVTLGATSFTFYDPASAGYVTGTYQIVYNSGILLTNHSGTNPGSNSDLIMYKIDPTSSPYGSPNLPQLLLAPHGPAQGDTVVAVGRGLDRAATQTYWDQNWQTVSNIEDASNFGYIVTGPQQMRWGDNTVAIPLATATLGPSVFVQAYTTNFDLGGGSTANEFQATVGDSGGAVFEKINGVWMLSGMIDGLTLLTGQPYPSDSNPMQPLTAAFGDSTIIADIASYRADMLKNNPLVGDANGDGIVNLTDLTKIASTWQTSGPAGDVNGDGVVSLTDLTFVASHWTSATSNGPIGGGSGGGGGGASIGFGVPEPETGALALAGALILALICLRRVGQAVAARESSAAQ